MAFDVQKALADGHSPAEIADYLGKRVGFDTAKARADGHPDADILRHVMQKSDDIQQLHEGRLGKAQSALSAEQLAAAPTSVGDKALVAGDLAASGLSKAVVGGVAGGAAGLLARVSGHDPAAAHQWVDDNMVYHPQTKAGQDIGEDFGNAAAHVLSPIHGGLVAADQAVGDTFGTGTQRALRQTLGTATDIASVLPGVGAVAEGLRLSRALKAADAVKLASTPEEIAAASGHKMLPSTVNDGTGIGDKPSVFARVGEKLGGRSDLQRTFIKQDLANANDLAAQGIGLAPKTVLTNDAIKSAKVPFAAVYNKIRKMTPPATLSQDTQNAILAAGRGTASKLELPANIQKIKDQLAKGDVTWTSNEVLDTMSDLRNKATKDLMSSDSDIVARGHAQMDIAKALEGHLDEQLSDPLSLVSPEEFKAARTGFAKIYTVDNARYGNDVNPQDIAKLGRETRIAHGQSANTGELAIIESNATHSPHESAGAVPPPAEVGHTVYGLANRAILGGPQWVLRKALDKTRGVTRGVAARDNPALANFFEKDRPARAAPQPFESWTASTPEATGPRAAPASDYASVLAGDLKLGEHSPDSLSLAPEPTHFPKAADLSGSEASRLAQDLSLESGPRTGGSHGNMSDYAGVRSQGVPEGILARAAREAKLSSGDFYDPTKIDPSLDEIIAKLRGE